MLAEYCQECQKRSNYHQNHDIEVKWEKWNPHYLIKIKQKQNYFKKLLGTDNPIEACLSIEMMTHPLRLMNLVIIYSAQ